MKKKLVILTLIIVITVVFLGLTQSIYTQENKPAEIAQGKNISEQTLINSTLNCSGCLGNGSCSGSFGEGGCSGGCHL
jgi:hypothetical protein